MTESLSHWLISQCHEIKSLYHIHCDLRQQRFSSTGAEVSTAHRASGCAVNVDYRVMESLQGFRHSFTWQRTLCIYTTCSLFATKSHQQYDAAVWSARVHAISRNGVMPVIIRHCAYTDSVGACLAPCERI